MTLLRYVLIQLAAYGIDMGGFLAALALLGPIAANLLAKSAAGLFAFFAHRHFTFRTGRAADRGHQAWRYFLLLALNLPLSSAVLAVLLVFIDLPAVAKLAADVLCLLLNFWLSRSFVFTEKPVPAVRPVDSSGAST